MKRNIKVWDEAGHILEHVGKGVLLTCAAEGKVNTMTIGWGTLGIEWGKPIFIAFVRESRYTKELLDKNPEFTVNIPYGQYDKSILSICGTPKPCWFRGALRRPAAPAADTAAVISLFYTKSAVVFWECEQSSYLGKCSTFLFKNCMLN